MVGSSKGARKLQKLSEMDIARLSKVPGRHSDGGNLYLEVAPGLSSSISFLSKMTGQCGWGSDLSPEAWRRARDQAAQWRELIAKGINPLEREKSRKEFEAKLDSMGKQLASRTLLTEREIVAGKRSVSDFISGVYFLIDGESVVYVGQSVNIFSRIADHADKAFDSWAYIPCPKSQLNILESLYIHFLQPKLNGKSLDSRVTAPLKLDRLLAIMEAAE